MTFINYLIANSGQCIYIAIPRKHHEKPPVPNKLTRMRCHCRPGRYWVEKDESLRMETAEYYIKHPYILSNNVGSLQMVQL